MADKKIDQIILSYMTPLVIPYEEGRSRHLQWDSIKHDAFMEKAICGHDSHFPETKDYLLTKWSHNIKLVICEKCIKKLSMKLQKEVIHILVINKFKVE